MKVLLTGGAGYIGSHTAVELLDRGYDVVVLDDLSNGHKDAITRVEKITGRPINLEIADLNDSAAVDAIFSEHEFGAVFHFAGLKSVSDSVSLPLNYYRANVGSTIVLLEAMHKHRVRKLIFSSSATVYGNSEDLPTRETSKVGEGLTNPYARTKAMIEQILMDIADAMDDFGITILRYFNPVGAHHSGLIGEDPRQTPNNLMPYVSQVAAGQREHVSVFGNTYQTPDGTGVRDYVHVMDLASGHAMALERTTVGCKSFNLGTGRGHSVLEVIDAFSRASGRPIAFEIAEPRIGDVATSFADVTKAEQEIGWHAKRTLDDACVDAWRWQTQNPRGYK